MMTCARDRYVYTVFVVIDTVDYGYDSAGRKTIRTQSDAAGVVVERTGYLYDGITVTAELDLTTSTTAAAADVTRAHLLGPAANEVARLESLTKSLGRRVVASADLAALVDIDWQPLGDHCLRGINEPVTIFALP